MQVPPADNYFAALNSAVFTDGSFVYIPKGVNCPMELSTYFRINAEETGQVRLVMACYNTETFSQFTQQLECLWSGLEVPSILRLQGHACCCSVCCCSKSKHSMCFFSLSCSRFADAVQEDTLCLQLHKACALCAAHDGAV